MVVRGVPPEMLGRRTPGLPNQRALTSRLQLLQNKDSYLLSFWDPTMQLGMGPSPWGAQQRPGDRLIDGFPLCLPSSPLLQALAQVHHLAARGSTFLC